MKICLRLYRSQCRAWLKHLIDHIGDGHALRVDIVPQTSNESALQSLLDLEAMLIHRHRQNGASLIDPDTLGIAHGPTDGADLADLIIDFTDTPDKATKTTRVISPAYDGARGEEALASLLLAKGSPLITLDDMGAEQSIASGTASLEAARGLSGGMEAVYSRVIFLLARIVRQVEEQLDLQPVQTVNPISSSLRTKFIVKNLATSLIRAIYQLCCFPSHWRIGYRHVEGKGVFETKALTGTPWTVLDHPYHHFYADPVLIHHKGRDYLFFEDLNHHVGKGTLSVVRFDENGKPGPTEPVLEEPWHLSYPFMFKWQDDIWMIPESSNNKDVALYRATDFPLKWERYDTLLSGLEAADATIIEHGGAWWMFAVERDGLGGYSDTLCLYKADNPLGPWQAHPKNPVLIDHKTARPAGDMIHRDGKLWRPVQDCEQGYGTALVWAEVTQLDDNGFEQRMETVIYPGGAEWPGRKLHTYNRVGNLEVIDGCIYRPRLQALGALADRYYHPK